MAQILIKVVTGFLAFVSALILTFLSCLIIITHDPLVIEFLEARICAQASNAFECDFNARIYRLDLLNGTILLSDVMVLPQKGRAWFWRADSIKTIISWPKLFTDKEVHLTLLCGKMQINSQLVDGKIAIGDHIAALTREKEMAIPFIPDHVQLQQATISIHIDPETTLDCVVSGAIDIVDNQQHIGLTVVKDSIKYREHHLLKDLELSIKKITDLQTGKGSAELHGTVQVRNAIHDSFCSGKLAGKLGKYGGAELSFISDDQQTQAIISHNNGYQLLVKTIVGSCTVTTDFNGVAAVNCQQDGGEPVAFTIDYSLGSDHIIVKVHDEKKHELNATFYYDGHYTAQGTTEFFYALLQASAHPEWRSQSGVSKGKYADLLNYKARFDVKGSRAKNNWLCEVDLSELQIRIPYTYNFLRSAHATLVYSTANDYLVLHDMSLQTDRGRIKSGISTVALDADHTIQSAHIPIIVEDFFINQAKDFFAELSGACTIEYHKDHKSKVQGICALKKCHIRNNPFSGGVGGDIVSATINPFLHHPLAQSTELDITLRSYEPVDIKTGFLQARAHVTLQALGTAAQPQLYGHIEVLSGTFNFPYKPLEISYGKIFFVDNAIDDPSIELCATAFIKNYAITMYVDGTARQPNITFQSTPSLQEEQIIGLLFGGSEDSSLSLVMPLSSMSTVEKLIVGSPDDSSGAFDSLKSWLGPLQNVKIVPRFSDQTSRGGLRAALAIEVNENLSALIQQNFSLSEDTLIEVAYKPLDELTIRGMRDERGDFGGEVEACFTW